MAQRLMSITDVQRAFVRGLDGKGSCKLANIELEDGGRTQRLNFHVIAATGSAYLSELIPADMCPMQHARYMAQEFLQGRIAGQSRMASAPVIVQAAPVPVVTQQLPAPASPDRTALVPGVVAPAPVVAAPAAPQAPADVDELDRHIAVGNLDGVIDLLCRLADDDAGAIRDAWVTATPGQTLEYEQVRREINDLAYQLVQPTPDACPCLWASVGVDVPKTGDNANDIRAAAALINQCIDATNDFLARVRSVRLQAKAAIRSATSIEDALAVYQAIDWPAA